MMDLDRRLHLFVRFSAMAATSSMFHARLAVVCLAGLAMVLQSVSAEIPVSFDHGNQHAFAICQ